MATLYNTLERAASVNAFAVVNLELVWDTDAQSVPLNSSEESSALGDWSATTDSDGKWIFETVDPNTDITPTGSNVYKVTETVNGEEGVVSYVEITGNGSYWLGDVIVSTPAWV